MHGVDQDFLPDIGGAVERFIVNRHGQVDGLILSCSRSTARLSGPRETETPGSLVSSIAPMRHRGSSRSRWLVALSVLLVGLVVAIAIAAALAPTLLPAGDQTGGEGRRVAAGVIFAGSYLALAIGRIPGLSIDRAGIALVGAGLMVASGALPLDDAYKAIDLDTITLLLGMMIVVANLRLSGFFAIAMPGSWPMPGDL